MSFARSTVALLSPDQLAAGRELHEVVGLPVPKALTLIGGLIVNRLARIVSDVNGPIERDGMLSARHGPELRSTELALPA